jgi:hypothetical protein
MDILEVKISKKNLESLGAAGLTGLIISQVGPVTFSQCKQIRLLFEQTSTEWRAQHNGPEAIVCNEFSPMCLAEDIVYLTTHHQKEVLVGEYILDSKR